MSLRLAFVVAALVASALAAQAQTKSEWFKSLLMPRSAQSCCDISDCKVTKAAKHGDDWWAIVGTELKRIPPDRILETESYDGQAYVCSTPQGVILCFVPPGGGY